MGRRRFRRRAVLKCTGAALCVLIFAPWVVSGWESAWITHVSDGHFSTGAIGGGEIGAYSVRGRMSHWPEPGWYAGARRHPFGWTWGFHAASMPLYALFAAAALSTAWLFYRDRRGVRWRAEGRRVGCGYDLAGLTGSCPECGRPA